MPCATIGHSTCSTTEINFQFHSRFWINRYITFENNVEWNVLEHQYIYLFVKGDTIKDREGSTSSKYHLVPSQVQRYTSYF